MAQRISNLNVGDKIKITGLAYDQNSAEGAYETIVVARNHPGYPNGVVLMTEFVTKRCAFDAQEPTNPNSDIRDYGSSRYAESNLLQWLNSSASTWYTPKHQYDQAPTSSYVTQGQYDAEPGFMSNFPAAFNALLLNIPAVTLVAGTAETETVTSKWALPSITELYGTHILPEVPEGTQFPYFTSNERRKCLYRTGSVPSSSFYYYTRSPWVYIGYEKSSTSVLGAVTCSTGSSNPVRPSEGSNFVRPICLVSNDALVSDTPVDGYYSMVYNAAPTAPSTITVPATVNGGTNITVSWSAGADTDANLAGYILERSVNGGGWSQIYNGALRQFTDAITFGWASVAYRVKSYDAYNAQSGYATSQTRTVVNNTAPTITGTDGNLGSFSTAFTAQSYTINDAEGGTVTVVERLDGAVRRTYNATLGTANSFSFTASEWRQILNGQHTLTITATDSLGLSTVRTWTFTKAMNTLTFTITPLPADAMPDRCVVAAVGGFPAGSTLKVEVCNNANDASPKWEDVSDKLGKKHFFTNTTKTAAAWAFGLRCTLTRGTATGSVWLDYITINYR